MKVAAFELAFEFLKNHPIWSSVDQEITKISSTSQPSILVFDNKIALLYFDILRMKMTELNFEVSQEM